MGNQITHEAIRSHSLTRFLNDEKLSNLDAKGRELVSSLLQLANWQMRAPCNNREAQLNNIDRELDKLAQDRDFANKEYAGWTEQERARLVSRKMAICQSIARAQEQGCHKDHSGLREAVDSGKPIPEGTELPFFLTEAIEIVDINGSPENNRDKTNLLRWTNPALWYLVIRDLLLSFRG